MAETALMALAQYDDLTALPTLLKLTDSPDSHLRALAARALSTRSSPAAIARLIALLEGKDGSFTRFCSAATFSGFAAARLFFSDGSWAML